MQTMPDIQRVVKSFGLHFINFFLFFIDFDGDYIVRTDEGQPRPKYIFYKCGTNISFFYSTVVLRLFKKKLTNFSKIVALEIASFGSL